MNGLEQVKNAVAGALEKAGIRARIAYAPGWAKAYAEPVVVVGLRTLHGGAELRRDDLRRRADFR